MNKKLQVALSNIEIANSWEQKNETGWVVKCLKHALMNYFSFAICEIDNHKDAITWLKENQVDLILGRLSENIELRLKDVENGKLQLSALSGIYNYIVFAYFSYLLDEFETGKFFEKVGYKLANDKCETSFWITYARCFHEFIIYGKPVENIDKPKGQEKYWSSYIYLMNAAIVGVDLTNVIQEVDSSFKKRNLDKSIKDDNYEIDGTAQKPALWDFRKEAILKILELRS